MGDYSRFTFYTPPEWEPVPLTPEQRQLAKEAKALGLEIDHPEPIGGEMWRFDPLEEVFTLCGYAFWESRRGFDDTLKEQGWRCWMADERCKFYQHAKAFGEMSRHYRDQLIMVEQFTEEGYRFVSYYLNGNKETMVVNMSYPVPSWAGEEGEGKYNLKPWQPRI